MSNKDGIVRMRTPFYKKFQAEYYWSKEDGCYVGRLIGLRDIVTFTTLQESHIQEEFEQAVDDYLQSLVLDQ